MKAFNFLKAFKKQNATDERLQLILFKGGYYAFALMAVLLMAATLVQLLRLQGIIELSGWAMLGIMELALFGGLLFFVIYLLKNGVFAAQREEINRKPQAQRFKWFFLIGGFFWMLIFIPAFHYFVLKEPWQETIWTSLFIALFYVLFTWYFQYRKINNGEE